MLGLDKLIDGKYFKGLCILMAINTSRYIYIKLLTWPKKRGR